MLEIFAGRYPNFGKAERKFEFIGDDKDRQLESLWKDTEIGNVLPLVDIVDEAERLIERQRSSQDATTNDNDYGEQKCDREVGGMKQNLTKRSSSGEDDRTPLWSIGSTRSFLF